MGTPKYPPKADKRVAALFRQEALIDAIENNKAILALEQDPRERAKVLKENLELSRELDFVTAKVYKIETTLQPSVDSSPPPHFLDQPPGRSPHNAQVEAEAPDAAPSHRHAGRHDVVGAGMFRGGKSTPRSASAQLMMRGSSSSNSSDRRDARDSVNPSPKHPDPNRRDSVRHSGRRNSGSSELDEGAHLRRHTRDFDASKKGAKDYTMQVSARLAVFDCRIYIHTTSALTLTPTLTLTLTPEWRRWSTCTTKCLRPS